ALGERLAHDGGNAGAQRYGVALAVLEALDAELLVLDRERRPVGAADRHERRQIDAPTWQFLGELEARARRGRVRVDRIIEQAEAVVFAHALILLALL